MDFGYGFRGLPLGFRTGQYIELRGFVGVFGGFREVGWWWRPGKGRVKKGLWERLEKGLGDESHNLMIVGRIFSMKSRTKFNAFSVSSRPDCDETFMELRGGKKKKPYEFFNEKNGILVEYGGEKIIEKVALCSGIII